MENELDPNDFNEYDIDKVIDDVVKKFHSKGKGVMKLKFFGDYRNYVLDKMIETDYDSDLVSNPNWNPKKNDKGDSDCSDESVDFMNLNKSG